MRPGARISAAIEVLETVLTRHQPVGIALADWGKAHRFAGSGDRNAIGHYVYDSLRYRASSAHIMGADTPRALVLGAARERGLALAEIAEMCSGQDHCPEPLTDDELTRFQAASIASAPDWVLGNYPEWLHPAFERAFGSNAQQEGLALSRRAPADLRVNTLKVQRDKALASLEPFAPQPTALSPHGIRIAAPIGDARIPNLEAEAAFQAGWFEIQDEGSQLAAAMSGAGPRLQVLDFCAGAGGKTLAMAAAMQNTGQIFAYDSDRNRLKPIFERIKRSNARNIQVLRAGDEKALNQLGNRFDVVLVDAPCTGTGTWRRRPDAKWRVKANQLADRIKEQHEVLEKAAPFVKPGGRLVYVTCSILPDENGDQVESFLAANPHFRIVPYGEIWSAQLPGEVAQSADGRTDTLLLTPRQHGTDGFFIAILQRSV